MIINAQAMINLDMTVRKVLADKDSMALTLVVLVASVAAVLKISLALSSVAADKDPNAPQKGDDLQYTMTLTFEEAVFGTTKISIRKDVTCETCHGDGAKPGTSKKTCSYCNGAGHVAVEQNTILGRVRTEQVCPKCNGSGQEFEEACPTCHGKGTENKTVKLEVKVPEGVDNEQQIRLAGEGSPGVNGGPAGDLYVVFRVKPSETFKRDGDDIYYKLNVSFPQAALGDEIKIPTLNNEVMLTIPAGTQTGKQFRLKEKGIKMFMAMDTEIYMLILK